MSSRPRSATEPRVDGFAAPGFEAVADEFARSFAKLGEVGAAFAAFVDGEAVVDVWGGTADVPAGRPWERDTLQVIHSGTKGLTAACVLLLLERGLLALDEPVATWWPEFGAAGKERITLGDVVSHRAGLPALQRPPSPSECTRPDAMAARLAAQPPFEEALGRPCYHAVTFGWILAELVLRVDGRSIGRFFADEIARPLGLDCWIGLPDEEHGRVSRMLFDGPPSRLEVPASHPLRRVVDASHLPILAEEREFLNSPSWWRAENAAGGAVATARSVARFYACLARGGEIDGVRIMQPETVELGRTALVRADDALWKSPAAYGVGFALHDRPTVDVPCVAGAFGHGGFGGSLHGAWPDRRVGYSYTPNLIRLPRPDVGPQSLPGLRLLAALRACV